jgi:hypothetical protein
MKRTARLAVAGIAVAGFVGLVSTTAHAADPNCVGKSLSALAMHSQGNFGSAVVFFAQEPGHPGLGDGIANLRAGNVPDDLVPNVCN